ncbi:hypothetical protein FRC12_022903, partial [Ceratobasidium sp. 428]
MNFDYPITRPYPWRFATSSIVVVSAAVFSVVLYFNVLVVGTTIGSTMLTTYQEPRSLAYMERMSIRKALNSTLGCDPTTLVAGGTYRTPNGAFTYTIQNFVDRNTRETFSSMSYSSSSLSSCIVQSMAATANFVAYEVMFVAYINCSLTGDIDMVASAPSLVSLSIGSDSSVMKRFETELYHKATHSTYIAPAVAKLLVAFGLDIFN